MSVYLVCFHLIPDKSLRACNKPQPCGDRKMGQAKKPPHSVCFFGAKRGPGHDRQHRGRRSFRPWPFRPWPAEDLPAGGGMGFGGRAAQAAGQGGTEAQELSDLNLKGRQRTEWPGARDSDWRPPQPAGPAGERAIGREENLTSQVMGP